VKREALVLWSVSRAIDILDAKRVRRGRGFPTSGRIIIGLAAIFIWLFTGEKQWHPTMGRSGKICKLQPDGRRNIRNRSFVVPSL
jgi:hypothetical protein